MMTIGVMEFEVVGRVFTALSAWWLSYRFTIYMIEARLIQTGWFIND